MEKKLRSKDEWGETCPRCSKAKTTEHDFCPDCERALCPRCKRNFTDGKLCESCKPSDHAPSVQSSLKKAHTSPSQTRILVAVLILATAIGCVLFLKRGTPANPAEVPPSAAYISPTPYRLCTVNDISTSSGTKRMKLIIATKERNMSTLTTKQLAATAYSALSHFKKWSLTEYSLVNVLLMESCESKSVTLARAETNEGRIVVEASSTMENGPSALSIVVTENIEQQKAGKSRITTSEDYAAVGLKMNMQADEVKRLHFELAAHVIGADFYDTVASTPATSPVKKD